MKLRIPKKITVEQEKITALKVNFNVPKRTVERSIPINSAEFIHVPNQIFNLATAITYIVSYENGKTEYLRYPDKYRCVYHPSKPPGEFKENKSTLRLNDDIIYANTQEDKQLVMSILDSLHEDAMSVNNDYLGSKNLIYYTVSNNVKYVDLLKLSIRSIIANTVRPNFDFLIITTEDFVETILADEIVASVNPIFHIIEEPADGVRASMTKLEIFDYPALYNYRNILFLDVDILAVANINSLFDSQLTTDNLLTVCNSTVPITSHNSIYHGLDIVDTARVDAIIEAGQMPFNAGQFMFKNSERMKAHFDNVRWFASVWPGKFFFEQAFMNRYFCGYCLTDHHPLMNQFIITSSANGCPTHKLHEAQTRFIHFTAPPLDAETKLTFIEDYINAHQLTV